MSSVFLFCLVLGASFTFLGAALGHFMGGGEGGGDPNGAGDGAEFSHGYEAAGGDGAGEAGVGEGDVGTEGHGSVHLPILSPTVLSFLVASFGGSGLVYQHLFAAGWLTALLAAATALAMALALAWGIFKLTSSMERNHVARLSDALTGGAEVSVSVPVKGVGEIAYVSAGSRQTLSARSADGRAYRQGTRVRVLRVQDGVAYVGELPPRTPLIDAGSALTDAEPARGEPVRNRVRP